MLLTSMGKEISSDSQQRCFDEYVSSLQNDILCYRQFVADILTLFREKDKRPDVMLQGSPATEHLCSYVWDELVKIKEKEFGKKSDK